MAAEARLGDDASLHLVGELDRSGVVSLWPVIESLRHRAQYLELGGITSLDSAGLALISILASQGLAVRSNAHRLDDLATAYRLESSLSMTPPLTSSI